MKHALAYTTQSNVRGEQKGVETKPDIDGSLTGIVSRRQETSAPPAEELLRVTVERAESTRICLVVVGNSAADVGLELPRLCPPPTQSTNNTAELGANQPQEKSNSDLSVVACHLRPGRNTVRARPREHSRSDRPCSQALGCAWYSRSSRPTFPRPYLHDRYTTPVTPARSMGGDNQKKNSRGDTDIVVHGNVQIWLLRLVEVSPNSGTPSAVTVKPPLRSSANERSCMRSAHPLDSKMLATSPVLTTGRVAGTRMAWATPGWANRTVAQCLIEMKRNTFLGFPSDVNLRNHTVYMEIHEYIPSTRIDTHSNHTRQRHPHSHALDRDNNRGTWVPCTSDSYRGERMHTWPTTRRWCECAVWH